MEVDDVIAAGAQLQMGTELGSLRLTEPIIDVVVQLLE